MPPPPLLPQLGPRLFLTDGGIETTLIYRQGLELPHFAAFVLLLELHGASALKDYFLGYARLARGLGVGLVLESATWRANADWAARLGLTAEDLSEANRRAVRLLEEVRREHATERSPMVISGCVGPRGDGYEPGQGMGEREAEAYHAAQIEVLSRTAAEMVCAMTLTYTEEAIGIARAARHADMPVALSFTVETDGHLPTGESLAAAIRRVDQATRAYPAYYMVNCAHPTHFSGVLGTDEVLARRVRGLRANASARSHAELNASTTLDAGDPEALAQEHRRLLDHLPGLRVVGGCCGTDERHVEAIARALLPRFEAAAGPP